VRQRAFPTSQPDCSSILLGSRKYEDDEDDEDDEEVFFFWLCNSLAAFRWLSAHDIITFSTNPDKVTYQVQEKLINGSDFHRFSHEMHWCSFYIQE
jgi:hypothetical protein